MPILDGTIPALHKFVRQNSQYRPALARFLGKNPPEEYSGVFHKRPLMGITDEDRVDFVEIVERHLAGTL